MSTFSFSIPKAEVATLTGNAELPADTEVVFDKGLHRSPKFQVLNAQFGDGYEQRVKDGINAKRETYAVAFNKRTAEEVNLVAAYFDSKIGQNITISITNLNGDELITAVCDGYDITYIHELYHSLTANLRRVYEP